MVNVEDLEPNQEKSPDETSDNSSALKDTQDAEAESGPEKSEESISGEAGAQPSEAHGFTAEQLFMEDEEDALDADNLLITYGFGVAFTIVPEYIQCITFGFSDEEAMLNYFFGWYSFEDYPRIVKEARKRLFW